MSSQEKLRFKPRARMLQLLGDELIKSARLAVFELVKNSYDADASFVRVELEKLGTPKATITVTDDGFGMAKEVIEKIWFVPGHEHKRKSREKGDRSPKGRLPLGEKGVGRFAVHKLGNKVSLVTKAEGHDEVALEINFAELTKEEFLEDAFIEVTERSPEVFTTGKTGTRIIVSDLRDAHWSRGDLRRLYRDVTSICSPFDGPDEFDVQLSAGKRSGEFDDIPDAGEIMDRAIWHFQFRFDGKSFDWSYRFAPPHHLSKKVNGRTIEKSYEKLLISEKLLRPDGSARSSVVADEELLEGIGTVSGEFFVYDRDREVLSQMAETGLLKSFLNENGGVRIYRDGVRVYNYGEEDDDWLGLDLARVQSPTVKISRNILLGLVNLDISTSTQLKEKTNREGFVENDAFVRLRAVVSGALSVLQTERKIDKDAIRKVTAKPAQIEADKIKSPIAELRRIAKRNKLQDQLEPSLLKLEKNYNELRESMLQAGLSGLGLATVFHEIEHGVRALHRKVVAGADIDEVQEETGSLVQLLSGIAGLLRQSGKRQTSASEIVKSVRSASLIRFKSHRVELVSPLMHGEQEDFDLTVNSRLMIGALTNLLDNSFYWMRARWPSKPEKAEKSPRRLYLGRSDDFEAGPALIIADTGPGLSDDPETLVEPFFTRRPEGMGLGLYYANLVMELSGGSLVFPDRDDVDIPPEFDGAVIAMVFPEK